MPNHCSANVPCPPREKRGYGAELQDRAAFYRSDDSRWMVAGSPHWSWKPPVKRRRKAKRRPGIKRYKAKLWRPSIDSLADAFSDFNPYGHIAQ